MIFRKTAAGFLTVLALFIGCSQTIFAENNESDYSFNFEGNNSQGWGPFGTGLVYPSNEAAFSGEYSLKSSNRDDRWNGPVFDINSNLKAEQKYSFSINAMNASGETDTFSATIKTTDAGGVENYSFLGTASAEPGQWVTITGSFSFVSNLSSALLYIETQTATGDFFIDDVIFTPISSEGSNNQQIQNQNETVQSDNPENESLKEKQITDDDTSESSATENIKAENSSSNAVQTHSSNIVRNKLKYEFTFEKDDMYDDNFYAFNSGRLIRNKDKANKGSYSLYTAERKNNDDGPALPLDFLKRNTEYAVSVNVLYDGTEYSKKTNFSLCLGFFKSGVLKKQVIRKIDVKKAEWTKLDGTFSVPMDGSNPFLYIITDDIQANNESSLPVSFYIDDLSLKSTSVHAIQTVIFILILVILLVIAILIFYFSKFNKNILSPDKKTIIEDIDPETGARTREAYNRDVILLIGNPNKTIGKYIAVFDINSFSSIEKLYGKKKSDQALKRCADMLLEAAGDDGTVYRTGSNEFVCISETDLEAQFSRIISVKCSKYEGYPFSVAQGYDKYNPIKDGDEPDIRNIISRADEKMCINKANMKKSHSSFE